MVRIYLFLLFSISFVFLSCDKNIGEEVLYSPDLKMPVVTGLFVSGYDDMPGVSKVWGSPSGRYFCSPTIGDNTNISLSNPYETNVKIWVVPARLPNQNSNDILNLMNGYFTNASGMAVAIPLNENKLAGIYSIEYSFKDFNGNLLPEGFYRIYIESDGWLRWCDVLNFRDESNYYKALVNLIQN
jgi:hypothetical protein